MQANIIVAANNGDGGSLHASVSKQKSASYNALHNNTRFYSLGSFLYSFIFFIESLNCAISQDILLVSRSPFTGWAGFIHTRSSCGSVHNTTECNLHPHVLVIERWGWRTEDETRKMDDVFARNMCSQYPVFISIHEYCRAFII